MVLISGDHSWPLERFRAKHALGLDPGVGTGSREENASKQEARAPFRLIKTENGSSECVLRMNGLCCVVRRLALR
jgi:hypothetical protein